MSKGEFNSVAQVNGGLEKYDQLGRKRQRSSCLIKYIADEDKLEKVLENPQVIKNAGCKKWKTINIRYQPDVWKAWK